MHIEPTTRGIDLVLVGEADALGDDARAVVVDQDDDAIGEILLEGVVPVPGPGTDRNPDPALGVPVGEVAGRQDAPVALGQERDQRAVPPKRVDTTGVTNIGDQEGAVRHQRIAVRDKPLGNIPGGGEKQLRGLITAQPGDAAALIRVAGKQVALLGRDDAFRTDQIMADEGEIVDG